MSVAVSALTLESIWFDKYKFGDAEQQYYERLQKLQWIESCSEAVESPPPPPPTSTPKSKAPANKPIKEDQEAKVAKHQDKKMAKEEKENVVKEEKDSSAQEKTDIEKEAEVKKPSKKSKKNKKKNQQLLEGKSEPQVSTPKGTGEGKKGKGDAHAKEFSQDDNKKSSEPKKSEKKDGKKDGLTGTVGMDILTRLQKLEEENSHLKNVFQELKTLNASLVCLSSRVEKLEKVCTNCTPKSASTEVKSTPTAPVTQSSAPIEKNDEDDVDLFGSDEEDDPEKEKIKAERLKMYEEKKSKKPTVVAKSNIILDVKPWDDETDMKAMETKVREVACDGLLWGASKLVPLAYGIHKLQISCVIEDDLVSVDWLQEQIEANEDLVQSVDIAAFNKV